MRGMRAGDGYKYLFRSVAAADGGRALSAPPAPDYAGQGTPPGRRVGGGGSEGKSSPGVGFVGADPPEFRPGGGSKGVERGTAEKGAVL